MTWKEGPIDGCVITPLTKYKDQRGWLAEFFRHDELPEDMHPVMGYISLTHPGVTRGPHEHTHQTDVFLFFNGHFKLYLWDTRQDSSTTNYRSVIEVGDNHQVTVTIPPGVVHAYRNIGTSDALVVNCPNKLYAGQGKTEPVDEIRHEDVDNSPFIID